VNEARGRLRWWREVAYVLAFYGVYTLIRNRGIATGSTKVALEHAKQMISVERFLGTFHEERIQDWFLGQEWFIQFWNVFYGTAHFIVSAVALIWLFRRMPERYPLWRNTLAFTTGLALIGFAFYPLMPPRLLDACGLYGGCVHPPYGFVDTLKEIGGLWSFDSGTMSKISNQYAAMPSLHCAWSLWVVCVLWPGVQRRWLRGVLVAYPFITLFCIVVTANHYWIDAAGGAAVLGIGFLLSRWFTARLSQRTPQAVQQVAT
jgi:hypothetical protein